MDIAVVDSARCTETWIREHARAARNGSCRIDLSGAGFVDPMGLVVVATVVGRAVEERHPVVFVPPEDRGVGGYMYRMGLGEALDGLGVRHGLPPVRSHPTGDRLVELTRFTDQSAADRLAERVYNIFNVEDPAVARALSASVEEITTNVLEHSDRACGYLALQQYDVAGRQQVAFAVGDHGIGLRARLSQTLACPDDETANRGAPLIGASASVAVRSVQGAIATSWSQPSVTNAPGNGKPPLISCSRARRSPALGTG